jgi:hypothetical protein
MLRRDPNPQDEELSPELQQLIKMLVRAAYEARKRGEPLSEVPTVPADRDVA